MSRMAIRTFVARGSTVCAFLAGTLTAETIRRTTIAIVISILLQLFILTFLRVTLAPIHSVAGQLQHSNSHPAKNLFPMRIQSVLKKQRSYGRQTECRR